jgi:hypothetical protein
MRVIIRFSLNGAQPAYAALYGKLRKILSDAGVHWTGNKMPPPHTTSTYEGLKVTEHDLRFALQKFWRAAEFSAAKTTAMVDHFWMYADRKRPPSLARKIPKKKST